MRRSQPFLLAAMILLLLVGAGCGASSEVEEKDPFLVSLAQKVDLARLVEAIDYMASENLEGRPSGSVQSQELEAYLEEKMSGLGLEPLDELGLEGYRQEFPVPSDRCYLQETLPADTPLTCANILAKIPGESSREMIVLTANYDGLGIDASSGAIYPGADYNASGAAAVLELATVFSGLEEKPEKSLIFAFLGAEECGGYGSSALAEALEASGLRDEVLIINIEGLGAGDGDYMDIWDLNYRKNRPTVEAADQAASLLDVVLELGGADPGTSAGVFFLYHIPAVTCDWSWFERNEHADFHLPSDTPDKINQDGLLQATQVIAVTAWTLAE
jgi:aminopeptidase YwaD